MTTAQGITVRNARQDDVAAIRLIFNQGIEDRIATLDVDPKTASEILKWYQDRGERYRVLVATEGDAVVGWASLNPYSHRCAYEGVADLSIYVRRDKRGHGIGARLLQHIERAAIANRFHKIVLFALPDQ